MTVKISHLDPMVANLAIYKLMKNFALRSKIDSFENSLLSVAHNLKPLSFCAVGFV